ncbi:hypothetical protein AB7849_09260 [Rhodanobacter sp. 115]|uniref:hypothetical protein n=1 Tax=Rhodanobacter sp. FW021-MT20 TaxID=1162282 RepID=UPI0012F971D9|nr:hypothetical protein [Rhodanobacter sp. 115]
MKTEAEVVYIEAPASARFVSDSPSSSARYVSYEQPSAVILDSLDQIMKNHTVMRTNNVSVDWVVGDSLEEA